jgi:hypothetical protein
MTQPYPNTPYPAPYQEYREEVQVMGEQLVSTVEKLLHEGNVRRIIIKQENHPILEIPLTVGVVGVLVAPTLAAVGAIGAALTNCTIEVVRIDRPEYATGPTTPPGAAGSATPPRTGAPFFSGMGGQSYSISQSGMRLFQQGPISTLMSGTQIDLVSAPIEPGEYRLEINVTMGGVEIFLPRYVQFTLEGSSIAGGRTVHEGPEMWETMKRKLRYIVNLPDSPPDFAFAPPDPERPVRIHFVMHIIMGGVDIYRL